MTTGTPPDLAERCVRRWAAAQLDLPADVSLADAKAAFLSRVRDEDFMPPAHWQQAYHVLAGAPPSPAVLGQALADDENRLRTEVEKFAVDFFRFDVPTRLSHWQTLAAECAFAPPLAARLAGLERGLRVVPPSGPERKQGGEIVDDICNWETLHVAQVVQRSDVHELVDYICELFVLRPHARAVRRQEIFKELGPDNVGRLAQAVPELAHALPAVASLDPVFLEQLTNFHRRAWARVTNRAEREAASAPAPSSRGSGGNYWWVIFVAIAVIRLCAGMGSSSTRSTIPQLPPSVMPPPPPVNALHFDMQQWKQSLKEELARPPDQATWPLGEVTRQFLKIPIPEECKPLYQELARRIREQRQLKVPPPP